MPWLAKQRVALSTDLALTMQQRISSIDAVRALALLGILLVHSHDHFNIYFRELPENALDAVTNWLYSNVLLVKAFMVFAFLFGLSFSLQMSRAAAKGVDFRLRFCWRLVLLAVFGLIHSFFYCGDILLIFAITGFLLVLVWKLRTRYLALAAAVCFMQPHALLNYLNGQPEILYEWYESVCQAMGMPGAPASATATWTEMGCWNITCGVMHSFLYTLYTYRIYSLVGLFLTGIVAGRLRLFECKPKRLLYLGAAGAGAYMAALVFFHAWGEAHGMRTICKLWINQAFVFMFIPLAVWALSQAWARRASALLQPIGRCTLTCYIMQSVVMLWLICGYGLALGPHLSTSAYMGIGALLYLTQLGLCHAWLKHFKYGPLEGVWRRLTRMGM